MGSTRTLTHLLAAALATTVMAIPHTAQAADLLVEPPVIEAPVVQSKSGWYLRGDIGYSFNELRGNPMFILPGNDGVNNNIGYNTFHEAEIDDALWIQGGIGYQVNDYLRVDATLGYDFESDFHGSTKSDFNCGGNTAGTACVSMDSDSYKKTVLLANAYVDLGSFAGFTPYVGAGIGGAHISYDGLQNTSKCVTTAAGTCDPALDVDRTANHGGEDSWRFAWALHAGASYDITHNLAIDVGYSFNRIEEGAMFGIDPALQNGDLMDGAQGFDKGLDEHVIRAGLRYNLW